MPSGLLRTWIEPVPVDVPPEFQAAIGGRPMVARILVQRGITDITAARAFLDPDAYTPCPPEALPGMLAACQRIESAIRQGETICVWGDFDVDGQTSTTLLVSALRGLGAKVLYHIPVRAKESHGVTVEALAPMLDQGAGLVVTCDTGIGAVDAVDYARSRGVDVIITDHHALPEVLPAARAIITPRMLPEGHALSGLPGVGVAYKLAEALYQQAGRGEEAKSFLDLVSLGIVADLAAQTGDTRYLLQRGLPVLRQTQRTGLQVMFELASLQPAFLTEEHIGFVLGPRLNALGRLDDANPAVELLTTADAGRARVLATHLEGLNARRRLLTAQVLRAAQEQIEKDSSLLESAALVLSHPEWPGGVIGIVASELVERYNRPTILLSTPPGQPARGSARSIEGVNITEAIASQKALLLGYGGHPMAAGLSLDPANLNAFRRGLSHYVEKALGGAPPRPTLAIDGQIGLADLTLDLVSDLERLAPFGAGNPPLVLSIPRLTVLASSTIGREGSHLQVVVKDEHDQTRRVLWWGGADWPLPEGPFDLACVVRASNYRGQRDVQVEWIDARPVEAPEIDLRRRLAVIDQRGLEHPLPVLKEIVAAAGPLVHEEPEKPDAAASPLVHEEPGNPLAATEVGASVWGEAEAREKLESAGLPVCDRTRLAPVETLIIWTTPPGRAELQAVLEATHPRTVVIFSVDPAESGLEPFLKRLAGLVKHVRERLGGQVELSRLAAATAQREVAVRLGLQWLEARGLVKIALLPEGLIQFEPPQGEDTARAGQILVQLRALLEETAAYRKYFKTAEKENLL
jgi:single-stranded-DNA-specific exonuclease